MVLLALIDHVKGPLARGQLIGVLLQTLLEGKVLVGTGTLLLRECCFALGLIILRVGRWILVLRLGRGRRVPLWGLLLLLLRARAVSPKHGMSKTATNEGASR